MEIRLIGTFEQVETVTRELRRQFVVITERDRPARNDDLRRYLILDLAPAPAQPRQEKEADQQ